jgi:hypothetical protein
MHAELAAAADSEAAAKRAAATAAEHEAAIVSHLVELKSDLDNYNKMVEDFNNLVVAHNALHLKLSDATEREAAADERAAIMESTVYGLYPYMDNMRRTINGNSNVYRTRSSSVPPKTKTPV